MDIDLDACLRGDRAAWADFVGSTLPVIRAAVRRALPEDLAGASDREDVVQQVYLRLMKDDCRLLRTYRSERAGLKTWLSLVARSVSIDQARRSVRQHAPGLPEWGVAGPDADPDHAAPVAAPLGTLIPLDALTDRQRLVLSLLFERDLTVAETANVLGVDQQTIRSTKHKAMLRLREHFATSAGDTSERPSV